MHKLIQKIKDIWNDPAKRKELIRYIVFGIATTAVNWLVYELMRIVTGMNGFPQGTAQFAIRANVANIVAWIVSVLFAFLTNKKFVFHSSRAAAGMWKELAMFVSARILSLVLFDIGLYSLLLFILPDRVGKLITNVFVVIFNYFASKFVIFKKEKK